MHFLFPLLVTLLQSPDARAGEIIGGKEAKPHSRPYMAYLTFRNESGFRMTCGAFLIREDFLLTAAHCWGKSMNIILGAHNIKKSEKTQQRIPVFKAIPHQQYDKKTFKNDIMLLQLKKVRLNKEVDFLPLPGKKDWIKPGKSCTVAGWGKTLEKRMSDTLQEVEIKVIKEQECMEIYPQNYNWFTQICAGDPKEQRAAFKGDSGGPLVCDSVAQGIVSYVSSCGRNPHVYTRISSFLPWIEKTMNAQKY
ncbi:cathepsin G-like [Macrotis lagotis]|uniref:cathepsin G-like n=1 Tax=Macrotis lagotis TaxID=92651 RepID=UPI003D690D36